MYQAKMSSSEEECDDPFAGLHKPFAGLKEMDFDLHGIYMDHEPEDEFITTLDTCKDKFLNVLLTGSNLRNASMTDGVKEQVFSSTDLVNEEEEEETS
ncbi:hypothetical protein LXL04_001018 [Taraxacum kok-saghyz]